MTGSVKIVLIGLLYGMERANHLIVVYYNVMKYMINIRKRLT